MLTQLIQFTYQKIYLKKQETVEKNLSTYISVLNTFQYKQYLCILCAFYLKTSATHLLYPERGAEVAQYTIFFTDILKIYEPPKIHIHNKVSKYCQNLS